MTDLQSTVILATERPELGSLIERLLSFEQDILVEAVCHTPTALLDAVAEFQPDGVVMALGKHSAVLFGKAVQDKEQIC